MKSSKPDDLFSRDAPPVAVAADRPVDMRFMVMGEGTMGGWMRRKARRVGIKDRLPMPGTGGSIARSRHARRAAAHLRPATLA